MPRRKQKKNCEHKIMYRAICCCAYYDCYYDELLRVGNQWISTCWCAGAAREIFVVDIVISNNNNISSSSTKIVFECFGEADEKGEAREGQLSELQAI